MPLEMILFMEFVERRRYILIDSIFFDTDCICAFLWVNEESLLEKIYAGKIIIPKEVYDEIDRPTIPHLKSKINKLIAKGSVVVRCMDITSKEYELYNKLINNSYKLIGKGEATAISLAKEYDGILGSNNLKDIEYYINKYSLKHVTTGKILKK